jgi:hypothetical protein
VGFALLDLADLSDCFKNGGLYEEGINYWDYWAGWIVFGGFSA